VNADRHGAKTGSDVDWPTSGHGRGGHYFGSRRRLNRGCGRPDDSIFLFGFCPWCRAGRVPQQGVPGPWCSRRLMVGPVVSLFVVPVFT